MADLAASKENPLAGVVDPSKDRISSTFGDNEKQHVMSTIEHMHNHRRLTSRQIQLLAIAGTIGKFRFDRQREAAFDRYFSITQ